MILSKCPKIKYTNISDKMGHANSVDPYQTAPVIQMLEMEILANCLFVCVEVLRPSQPNRVMSSAVSLPNHTFTGQA